MATVRLTPDGTIVGLRALSMVQLEATLAEIASNPKCPPVVYIEGEEWSWRDIQDSQRVNLLWERLRGVK